MTTNEKPLILNVDDSSLHRRTVSESLLRAGFRVREAQSGAEALRLAADGPDLILLDIELPDIRGYDVCRTLKHDPATSAIPVLHLSSTRITSADKAFGLEAGADGYLAHPIEDEVLIATIRALLRMRAAVDRVSRLQAVTAALSEALTPQEVAHVVIRHGVQALEAHAGVLALLGEDGSELEIVAEAGPPGWTAALGNGDGQRRRIPIGTPFPLTVCAWTGEPIWLESPEAYAASYPQLAQRIEEPIEALACIPMVVDKRTIGALGLAFARRLKLAEVERSFVMALAQHCAQALERARLFKAECEARAIAELAAAHERLARGEAETARAHIEAVLRQLPVGVVIAEAPSGRILLASEEVEVGPRRGPYVSAWSEQGLVGHRADGRPYGPADWPIARALRGEVVTGEEIRISQPDGTSRIERINASPIVEGGRITAAVSVIDDVTEEREKEAALRRSVQAREDLLAVVSHDLRNPLGLIMMGASMLAARAPAGDAGAEVRTQTERILKAGNRMLSLIRDVLEAASIEAGDFKIERERHEIAPIVRESLDAVAPLAAQKSIELRSELLPGLAASCDRQRLLQALVNLLGNAVKFTPECGVIRVQMAEGDHELGVLIADTGPGISRDQLPHLFDRYWKGSRTGAGTGLGLYITKGIVDAHRGAIRVESAPGSGSTFSIWLPLEEGAADRSPSDPGADAGP